LLTVLIALLCIVDCSACRHQLSWSGEEANRKARRKIENLLLIRHHFYGCQTCANLECFIKVGVGQHRGVQEEKSLAAEGQRRSGMKHPELGDFYNSFQIKFIFKNVLSQIFAW